MKIKFKTAVMLLLGVGLAASSCKDKNNNADYAKEQADNANKEKFDDKDSERTAKFVSDAVSANNAELALIKMAKDKTSDDGVRKILIHMETDHTALLAKLNAHAAKYAISVANTVPEEDQKDVQKLQEEKPGNFEKELLKELEKRHKNSIDDFEDYVEKGTNADIKMLAGESLPTLREHHGMVQGALEKYK